MVVRRCGCDWVSDGVSKLDGVSDRVSDGVGWGRGGSDGGSDPWFLACLAKEAKDGVGPTRRRTTCLTGASDTPDTPSDYPLDYLSKPEIQVFACAWTPSPEPRPMTSRTPRPIHCICSRTHDWTGSWTGCWTGCRTGYWTGRWTGYSTGYYTKVYK